MTLYEMLDKTIVDQQVWIFENNAYDQNMPLFKGSLEDARCDENVWEYLMCNVEFFVCSHGILDIRVRDIYYNEKLEGHYINGKNWGVDKSKRPWRWSIEIDEEKRSMMRIPKLEKRESKDETNGLESL